jgi:ankyrin repeat protein
MVHAVRSGGLEMVKLLLRSKAADVNEIGITRIHSVGSDGVRTSKIVGKTTALFEASILNYPAIVKVLIEYGADVNVECLIEEKPQSARMKEQQDSAKAKEELAAKQQMAEDEENQGGKQPDSAKAKEGTASVQTAGWKKLVADHDISE